MYLVNIFFDNNHNFQWASITALVALIASFVSAWFSVHNNKKTIATQKQMSKDNLDLQEKLNKSNFKGNVVSKARIEWIQEVRKKSVDFISSCYNIFEFVKFHGDIAWLNAENEKAFNTLKNEIEKNGTLLVLYFGPNVEGNKNNDLIVYLISSLLEAITNKDGYYDPNSLPELTDKVEILGDFLRIYFKAEWKRANGEIQDSEVQEYLEKHDLYIKAMDVFSSKLEEFKELADYKYDLAKEKYAIVEP
ncbi:TPA: hypothetical protein ROY16_000322 [Bacillus thuringiensis]|nr:hypothetical protein [Bacillus thuringiensis]